TWTNVTPKDLPEWARISMVEASPHAAGTAYVAANRFQLNDLTPYVYRTSDYGKSWARITGGITASEFVRVVREDPVRKGLLYAGTERGVWVSFDDGGRWQRLSRNLPPVPVHDLAVKEGDLVAATHGRAFWILDDITVLRQLAADQLQQDFHLYQPRDAYRIAPGFFFGGGGSIGWDGASVQYWLKKAGQKVTIDFLDAKGTVLRTFSSEQDSTARADSLRTAMRKSQQDSVGQQRTDSLIRLGVLPGAIKVEPEPEPPRGEGFRYTPPPRVPAKQGMNRFNWNLRAADATGFTGLIMWAGGTTGPIIPPGTYSVRITAGDKTESQTFKVLKDPRSDATPADLDTQYAFLLQVRDKTSEANNAVRTIRNVRAQLAERRKALGARGAALEKLSGPFEAQLASVEEEIYQVKNRSGQDPLNYPIRLNNQIAALGGVAGGAEAKPTAQSVEVFRMLSNALDLQIKRMRELLGGGLSGINTELTRLGLTAITPGTAELDLP
ncbi:MAG TPA: glycosyl hydrolase, partial [Gemmatimonadales bacterium]|nr:glycosyl hydrolase [Gemmatimonadales bacterium]